MTLRCTLMLSSASWPSLSSPFHKCFLKTHLHHYITSQPTSIIHFPPPPPFSRTGTAKNLHKKRQTHTTHPKLSENPPRLASLNTPIPNLRRPCIAMHLTEFQLCLGACTLWELGVADEVAEALSMMLFRISLVGLVRMVGAVV